MIRGLVLLCACVGILIALSAWTGEQVSGGSRDDGMLAAALQAVTVAVSGDVRTGGKPDHERRPCRDRLAGSLAPCAAFATLSSAAQVAPPSPRRVIFAFRSDRIPRRLLDEARFRPPRPTVGAARA